METSRFAKLSELKKGDVIRSSQFAGGLHVVVVINEEKYRPFIFSRKFFTVELRRLNDDRSHNYEGESVIVYPGLDRNNPDFFVEVMGQMNFNWSGITRGAAEG